MDKKNFDGNKTRAFNERRIERQLNLWGNGLVVDTINPQKAFEELTNAIDSGTSVLGRNGTNIIHNGDISVNYRQMLPNVIDQVLPVGTNKVSVSTPCIDFDNKFKILDFIGLNEYLPLLYDLYEYTKDEQGVLSGVKYLGSPCLPPLNKYRPLYARNGDLHSFNVTCEGNVVTVENGSLFERLTEKAVGHYIYFGLEYDNLSDTVPSGYSLLSSQITKILSYDGSTFLINKYFETKKYFKCCHIKALINASGYSETNACIYYYTSNDLFYMKTSDLVMKEIGFSEQVEKGLFDSKIIINGGEVFLSASHGHYRIYHDNKKPQFAKRINQDSTTTDLDSDYVNSQIKIFSFSDNDQSNYDFLLAGFSDSININNSGESLRDGGVFIE